MGFRPGNVPANLGRRCVKFKLVKSPWYNQKVYRCASYGPRVRRRRFLPPPAPALVRRRPRPKLPRGVVPVRPAGPPGRIPMSLPSMERIAAGRTPV